MFCHTVSYTKRTFLQLEIYVRPSGEMTCLIKYSN